MITTGAFLAEAAATVDKKLSVAGGVLSRFIVGPDRLARFVLMVLTRADVGDADRRVAVQIKPASPEESLHRRFEFPAASIGEFPGVAFFDVEVCLPVGGRWVIEVTCGGETVSLGLVVNGRQSSPSSTLRAVRCGCSAQCVDASG